MLNKKIASEIAIGIILLVAIIIGAIFWWQGKSISQQPIVNNNKSVKPVVNQMVVDEIAGWQTYANAKYGFEFKYPKDWKANIASDGVAENCNNGKTSCSNLEPEKQKAGGNLEGGDYSCTDSINFGIIKNEKKLQVRDFLSEEYGWDKESGIIKNNDIQETKFGNGFAYRFMEISGFDGSEYSNFWVTLDDGNFFNMVGIHLDADENKIFNQIISTFKFTDTINAQADWRIYKNKEYGFEITFTDAWKGYKTEKEDVIGGIAETIAIQLPTKDPKWANSGYMAIPLRILIYTPQNWPMASSDNFSPKYITKNDKYVFAYSSWQNVPSDLGSSNAEASKAFQFNEVISSFKLDQSANN